MHLPALVMHQQSPFHSWTFDIRHEGLFFSRQLEKRLASPGRERKACKCEQLFEDQRLAALSSLCTGQVEAVGV